MKLENKNVFITGSSRGIGLAIAHKFASLGANIVLNSRGQISEELLASFTVSRSLLSLEMYQTIPMLREWLTKRLKN